MFFLNDFTSTLLLTFIKKFIYKIKNKTKYTVFKLLLESYLIIDFSSLLTTYRKNINIYVVKSNLTKMDEANSKKHFFNSSNNQNSLETELSETLYSSMKDFVLRNPTWDQYKLINSALATFLVQNGCNDSSVTEIYINQLFMPNNAS